MKHTTIVAIILGVLVLISVVQAFQLTGLKTKISSEELTVSSSTEKATAPLASPATGSKIKTKLPSSIKNLPNMVGGC